MAILYFSCYLNQLNKWKTITTKGRKANKESFHLGLYCILQCTTKHKSREANNKQKIKQANHNNFIWIFNCFTLYCAFLEIQCLTHIMVQRYQITFRNTFYWQYILMMKRLSDEAINWTMFLLLYLFNFHHIISFVLTSISAVCRRSDSSLIFKINSGTESKKLSENGWIFDESLTIVCLCIHEGKENHKKGAHFMTSYILEIWNDFY